MSASDKVREAFEACVRLRWHPDASRDDAPLTRDERGGYFNTAVHYAWLFWLASRVVALAEARAALEGVDPLALQADWDSGESIACAVQRNAVRVVESLAAKEEKRG